MTLSVCSLLVTGVVKGCGGEEPAAAPQLGKARAAGAAVTAQARPVVNHAPLPPSAPKKVAVPGIMIEAPVMRLSLARDGRLGTPPMSKPRWVGWYAAGPSPGERGTAVVVGHRDTTTGPAIFLNLNALHPGDLVKVRRADHRTAVFTVDSVKTYTRGSFPNRQVYGDTGRAELRLLTCGGRFDHKKGYSANVVVFAHLTGVTTP
ncbi:peptidase C60 [Streptomyces sp. AcH 505]|uniref:class F sortase n=1 Tax=Streptomyces sp. AcH 505 TaxID=352211 RepID=UPI0005922927|nr:peptidase C60 [Streptomyces sp. AcH 505]